LARDWDVIVAGAGTAGMPVAIHAADRGARVLVIEHADRIGGTLHVSGGQMAAAGTRAQADQGIDDSPDDHYDDIMRISKGGANPKLARLAVDGAAESLHWLLDHGFEMTPGHPVLMFGHEAYSTPRTYWGVETGISILNAIQPLFEARINEGGVTLRLETEVVGLAQNDDKAVTGIFVRNKDGTREEISGANVVLTTGGYAANEELFPQYSDGFPLFGGMAIEQSQGTGIEIALAAGAELWGTDSFMPTFAGIQSVDDPKKFALATLTTPQLRQPWEIYVTREGRRFVAEDNPSVDDREHALRKIPDLTFWAVYDAAIAREAPPFLVDVDAAHLDDSGTGAVTRPGEGFEKAFDDPDLEGFVRADTLQELAKVTGIDDAGLLASVKEYNAAVASGSDPLGRTHLPRALASPPYFAIRHHGISVVSFAGLAIDEQLRVLAKDSKPIPNLYAAGEILGKSLLSGRSFVGGMSLLPSITFARIIGQSSLQWAGMKRTAAE